MFQWSTVETGESGSFPSFEFIACAHVAQEHRVSNGSRGVWKMLLTHHRWYLDKPSYINAEYQPISIPYSATVLFHGHSKHPTKTTNLASSGPLRAVSATTKEPVVSNRAVPGEVRSIASTSLVPSVIEDAPDTAFLGAYSSDHYNGLRQKNWVLSDAITRVTYPPKQSLLPAKAAKSERESQIKSLLVILISHTNWACWTGYGHYLRHSIQSQTAFLEMQVFGPRVEARSSYPISSIPGRWLSGWEHAHKCVQMASCLKRFKWEDQQVL